MVRRRIIYGLLIIVFVGGVAVVRQYPPVREYLEVLAFRLSTRQSEGRVRDFREKWLRYSTEMETYIVETRKLFEELKDLSKDMKAKLPSNVDGNDLRGLFKEIKEMTAKEGKVDEFIYRMERNFHINGINAEEQESLEFIRKRLLGFKYALLRMELLTTQKRYTDEYEWEMAEESLSTEHAVEEDELDVVSPLMELRSQSLTTRRTFREER